MKVLVKIISALLIILSVYLIVNGVLDIRESTKMSESAGLGAYAYWMGGLIKIGVAIILFFIGVILSTKNWGKKNAPQEVN